MENWGFLAKKVQQDYPVCPVCLAGTGHRVRRAFTERSSEHRQDPLVTQGWLGFEEIKARLVMKDHQAVQVSCFSTLSLTYFQTEHLV